MRTLGNGVSAHTASGGGGGCREKEQAGGRRQEASWVRREEDAADESAAGLARGGVTPGLKCTLVMFATDRTAGSPQGKALS